MTWRRRLIVATATLGGGLICFQPVMRARMESRLSEIVGGRVEIGSSKISLKDGAIALRDIVVHPFPTKQLGQSGVAPSPLRIQHAALKYSWKCLLFRNLTVDHFLASDVCWELVVPTSDAIPVATEVAVPFPAPPSEPTASFDFDIARIIQPLKIKMAEVADKQTTSHLNVSSRIKSVLERLAEVMNANESLNVLRQTYVLEDARKELTMLKQSIAEDRLARKDSDKVLNALRQSTQTALVASLEIPPEVVASRAKQSALKLAKRSVALEWNRNRPLIYAALNSLSALQPDTDAPVLDDAKSKATAGSNANEFLTKLPVGLTRCVAGKAQGVVLFPNLPSGSPEATSGFEIRFRNLSSVDSVGVESPMVTIKMTRDGQPDIAPWLFCKAQQVAIPQSEAKQVHFMIERDLNGQKKGATTIQQANNGWAATVSLPIDYCLEADSGKAAGLAIGKPTSDFMVIGKLIGTTQSGMESNEMLIEIEESSVVAFEAILSPLLRSESEKKRAQASIRGTELLNGELLQIAARWDQLGDEHSRAHSNWEASLQEVNDQLLRIESVFKRTSRATRQPSR